MTYQVGQILPIERDRGIVGDKIRPVWHVLFVAPQKEASTAASLRSKGVYAFYPKRERTRHIRGRKVSYEVPTVSGHVYALFRRQPHWDVLKEKRRLITGVLTINGWPVEIGRDSIRAVKGLPTKEERLEAERREMLRIRPGDKARFVSGPLEGFCVDIRDVRGKEAWVEGLFGGKVLAQLSGLERVIDPLTKSGSIR